MLNSNDISKLVRILSSLPESHRLQENELVRKARATVAFHVGDFKEVYSILQRNNFSELHHEELQKLSFDVHYVEAEKVRGRILNKRAKVYLSRKFPLPMTIWDGQNTRVCCILCESVEYCILKHYPSSEFRDCKGNIFLK